MSTKKSREEKARKNNDLFRDDPMYVNKKLTMSLPLPISVNNLHIRKRNGALVLTNAAQNYYRDARALINLAIEEQAWITQEYAVWLYIDMVFYFPDRRIRDSHNMLKLLLDVLQGVVYENDAFVLPRIQSVEYDPKNPRVDLVVTPQLTNERVKALKTIVI